MSFLSTVEASLFFNLRHSWINMVLISLLLRCLPDILETPSTTNTPFIGPIEKNSNSSQHTLTSETNKTGLTIHLFHLETTPLPISIKQKALSLCEQIIIKSISSLAPYQISNLPFLPLERKTSRTNEQAGSAPIPTDLRVLKA